MPTESARRVPILLWPFYALWRLVTAILELTGRLVLGVLGVALVVTGGILTATVVGAPVGIPLILLGVLLVARSLF